MLQAILNNRYQIIKKLGQGGFGTTYLVKDLQASEDTVRVFPASDATVFSSSLCTIKQLNPAHADIETAKKLFKREADILLRLGELPGVPKFIDYFEEDNRHYIVEEYIKGTSLDELIGEKWNPQQIVLFLWDTLSILQTLHQKNLIHRDIKPSNLIKREKDKKYTIIDFGAVKELRKSQLGMQSTGILSPGYAPPEQQRGTPKLNSDIYALGMTAIFLLTKTHPRELIKDENDDIIWNTNINVIAPKFLTDILNKMVKNDYRERYQSVDEVLKEINVGKVEPPPPPLKEDNKDDITQEDENNSVKNTPKIPWYIPLLLATIVIVGSEIIHPWIRPRLYLYQGNSLLDKNEANASIGKFQQVIELQPKSAAAWKGRGDALFLLRRYSGALEAYKKAIALEQNNLKALNNIGKISYKIGQFERAIEAHQKAIEIDENNADAWSSQGLAYMGLNQYEQALESFDKAQKIKPDEPSFWLQKGIVFKALQRLEEAKQFYQEALQVYDEKVARDSKNSLLWTDRGFVLLQLNRPEEAFESYDRALSLERNFFEALIGKANIFNAFQKYDRALEFFDKAIEVRPNDYQVWYNRGNLLAQALQNQEEALRSFEKVTQLKSDFYPGWLGKAIALIALERYENALQALDTAKDLNPQDPFVWLNRGIVFEETGDLQAAKESYQTAAIDLQYEPANEYLNKLP